MNHVKCPLESGNISGRFRIVIGDGELDYWWRVNDTAIPLAKPACASSNWLLSHAEIVAFCTWRTLVWKGRRRFHDIIHLLSSFLLSVGALLTSSTKGELDQRIGVVTTRGSIVLGVGMHLIPRGWNLVRVKSLVLVYLILPV